jgi:phosphoglycolate phosphatase
VISTALDGIDLVVFDKDGTLIDFHAMWGGWARSLAERLEGTTGRPVAPDVFAAIGFDPSAERIAPRSPLAVATMPELRELVATVIRRWCPNVGAARLAVDGAWFEPDPVTTAEPLTDLGTLFGTLRANGRRIAIATNDDRAPTLATLASLGVASLVDGLVCADDGITVKPTADAVLALGRTAGVRSARIAVVGDLPVDMAMGRAANAGRVIGVTSGLATRADLKPDADLVLPSVGWLLDPPLS